MSKTRRVLFVDDLLYRWDIFKGLYQDPETAHVEFVWAKDYDEAIAQLQNGKWDVVFLDHDLEDPMEYDLKMGWRDGSAIVDWIREHTPQIDFAVCHSMNPVGRQRMMSGLERSGYPARSIPFYAFDQSLHPLVSGGDGSNISNNETD